MKIDEVEIIITMSPCDHKGNAETGYTDEIFKGVYINAPGLYHRIKDYMKRVWDREPQVEIQEIDEWLKECENERQYLGGDYHFHPKDLTVAKFDTKDGYDIFDIEYGVVEEEYE